MSEKMFILYFSAGMDSSEAVRVTESKFESETFDQGRR